MSEETLFSRIIRREIAADIVHEDEFILGFRDINPQAPLHVLFIPKVPIATLDDVGEEHDALLGRLLRVAAAYARSEGYAESGYRTVINCRGDGGQTVFHLHLHLLAGRRMNWPPG